jgi:hypothetical protein
MKSKILLCCCLLSIGSKAQVSGLTDYGVIYDLTLIRDMAEFTALRVISDTTHSIVKKGDSTTRVPKFPKADKDLIIAEYFNLKTELDAAINQFQYDMSRKKSFARRFKRIDKNYRGKKLTIKNTLLKNLVTHLDNYFQHSRDFITKWSPPKRTGGIAAVELSAETVKGFLELGWTVYKDIQELRDKKVENLKASLDNIRLSPIGSLLEAPKKKE